MYTVTVCIHCTKQFKDVKNYKQHMDKYHPGNKTTSHGVTGKREKFYVCIRCSRTYVNQRSLMNHMDTCVGDMCMQAPVDILEPVKEGACIEISESPLPAHPSIIHHESPSTIAQQPTLLVSDPPSQPATARETVLRRSYQVKDPTTPLVVQSQQTPVQLQGSRLSSGQIQQSLTSPPNTLDTPKDSVAVMNPEQEEEIDVVWVNIK